MKNWLRVLAGILAAISMLVPASVHAQTVQLTLHDGRVSLVAENATPAQIFEAWSRAGGVQIVNANQMPSTPITLTLEDVPEEEALETLLRPVSGYLARHRVTGDDSASVFDRIMILPTPAPARSTSPAPPPPAAAAANPNPVFPQAPRIGRPPTAQQPAAPAQNGIPQGPGVMRLIGPDGRPVEDDQADGPPPQSPFNNGDAPDGRAIPAPRPVPVPPPQPQGQPQPPSTSAPVGVPVPGMVVPAPNTPGQPGSQTPGQPTQPPGQPTQPPQR